MNPDTLQKIDKTLSILEKFHENKLVGSYQYEKHGNFMKSIRQQFVLKGSLSLGQKNWFEDMQQRYTDEKLKDHAEWAKNYSDEHRRDAVRVAHYYASNPPYFQTLVRRIMDDPTCMLSINDYNKFCNNKYAKKILAEYEAEPKYEKGGLVQFRSTPSMRHLGLANKPAVVLQVEARPITEARKGAKVYQVLPVGDRPVYVCESELKRARRAKSK